MKRILAVIGSPRRNGNTHILVSKTVEGAIRRKSQYLQQAYDLGLKLV